MSVWLRGHQAALLVLLKWNFARGHPHKTGVCCTAPVSTPRKPGSAEGQHTSPLLLSSPGTWAGQRVAVAALRVHEEAPESSSAPSSLCCPRPRCGGGPQRAWGPEGPHHCQRQRCAVPLVPTRGPLAEASMGRPGTPLCNQDTAPHLPASLGQTLPPSWVVPPSSLALLPADFLVEELRPHTPTHDLGSPQELKGQQGPCVSFRSPCLPGVIRKDTHRPVAHATAARDPQPSFGPMLRELRKAARMNSWKNIVFKQQQKKRGCAS